MEGVNGWGVTLSLIIIYKLETLQNSPQLAIIAPVKATGQKIDAWAK
jgi:hypothetical protein